MEACCLRKHEPKAPLSECVDVDVDVDVLMLPGVVGVQGSDRWLSKKGENVKKGYWLL